MESVDLARRAVAYPRWRWLRGAVDIHGSVCRTNLLPAEPLLSPSGKPEEYALPDLNSPATLGCLLALVREAWSAPRALVRLSADGVRFHIFDVDRAGGINEGNWRGWLSEDYPSEAAALIAALEAAP